MPIPDFYSIMRPLLDLFKDGNVRTNQQIYDAMVETFALTEEEEREMLPSLTARLFDNRLAWAKTHLKHAKLIDSPQRGQFIITQRGKEAQRNGPSRITRKYLLQYPEYATFAGVNRETVINPIDEEEDTENMTPQDYLEYGFSKIKEELISEIKGYLQNCSYRFFERLVIDLLLAMGYGGSLQSAGSLTSVGADEGIDGVINEDKLGLDTIYVQAKRWQNPVGRPQVQGFAGALQGRKAKKGVFITTSIFTENAHEYANKIESKIVLIDGSKLAELMLEHNIGATIEKTYYIKKIDSDYFLEE